MNTIKRVFKKGYKLFEPAIKSSLRRFVLSVMYDEVERYAPVVEQVLEYQKSLAHEKQSYYEKNRNIPALRQRFIDANIPLEDVEVDIMDFERWLHDFSEIDTMYRHARDAHIEKCLEHYLAWKWLQLSPNDVYIDVASSDSIWADVLNKHGFNAYRLDLKYKPGIHGRDIGADAGATGLPNGFANALSLQCAYETFQGDADIRFIHEAFRILNNNGRFAILPLYTDDVYCIISSPYTDLSNVPLDEGAIRVWREDRHHEPFSRHYSPESFANRIYSQLNDMRGKIIHFTNLEDVAAKYPGQRIYCHFMFYCRK